MSLAVRVAIIVVWLGGLALGDGVTGYEWALWIAILSLPLLATLSAGVGLGKLVRR